MSDNHAAPTGAGIGQSVRDWLEEEGMLEEVEAAATQEAIAWQIEQAMTARNMTKAKLATAMQTSRSQVDRLLTKGNDSVQLATLRKAAKVLGRRLVVQLV